MSAFVERIDGPCPTCGGDGSTHNPFDANCPAEWAHQFIANAGIWSARDINAARDLANMGQPATPARIEPGDAGQ